MGFSLTGGTTTDGFNLQGSETNGFSLASNSSNPSNIYALDSASNRPASWSPYINDQQEQERMGGAYPENGNSWSENASFFGVSRLIDTATKAYVNVKGSQAATYAGQNGQTYTNQQRRNSPGGGGDTGLLMLIGAAFLLLG